MATGIGAAAVFAISGCGSTSGTTNASDAKPVSGGSLTIAISADPGSLDPQNSLNGPNALMRTFAYDTPVTLLNSGQLAPEVLSSWTVTKQGYSLTVRKGVTCSDGSPMDAQIVADNINYVGQPEEPVCDGGRGCPVGCHCDGRRRDWASSACRCRWLRRSSCRTLPSCRWSARRAWKTART